MLFYIYSVYGFSLNIKIVLVAQIIFYFLTHTRTLSFKNNIFRRSSLLISCQSPHTAHPITSYHTPFTMYITTAHVRVYNMFAVVNSRNSFRVTRPSLFVLNFTKLLSNWFGIKNGSNRGNA